MCVGGFYQQKTALQYAAGPVSGCPTTQGRHLHIALPTRGFPWPYSGALHFRVCGPLQSGQWGYSSSYTRSVFMFVFTHFKPFTWPRLPRNNVPVLLRSPKESVLYLDPCVCLCVCLSTKNVLTLATNATVVHAVFFNRMPL